MNTMTRNWPLYTLWIGRLNHGSTSGAFSMVSGFELSTFWKSWPRLKGEVNIGELPGYNNDRIGWSFWTLTAQQDQQELVILGLWLSSLKGDSLDHIPTCIWLTA